MATSAAQKSDDGASAFRASGPWTDLGLTLPIFVGYHLGVVLLPVRNAADVVTQELVALADNNLLAYGGLTLAIGAVFISVLVVLGRGQALRWDRFLVLGLEGIIYAVAMRLLAGYVVGRLFLGPVVGGPFTGIVMSLGAGFYEELAFRVLLFGLGLRLVLLMHPLASAPKRAALTVGWGLVAAAAFSAWHHVGPMADPFDAKVFVFRWVCGSVFTLIYALRGFAPAVWTHALYDFWALVF
jgi:hypothetical protein